MEKLHIILKIGMLMLANYKNHQHKLKKNLLKAKKQLSKGSTKKIEKKALTLFEQFLRKL